MVGGYSKLAKGTDYEVNKGVSSSFIKITKEFGCGKLLSTISQAKTELIS